jgi:hypothetical protein
VTDQEDGTVEGLTLERYTDLSVALFDKAPEEHEEIARSFGVPPGRLQAVIDGWTKRMEDPEVLRRHSDLYQAALAAAGVGRPEVSLELYVEMMKAIAAGTPADQVCAEHGMTLQQWALVAQHWGERMVADPQLGLRFAQAMGYTGGAPPA